MPTFRPAECSLLAGWREQLSRESEVAELHQKCKNCRAQPSTELLGLAEGTARPRAVCRVQQAQGDFRKQFGKGGTEGGRGEEQLDECSNLPSSSPIVFFSTYNSQYFLRRDESSQSGLSFFFFYAINTSDETCGQLSKWHSCPRAHIRQGNFGRVTPPDLLGLKSCCARYRLSPTVNLDSLQKKFNCAYAIAHLSRTTSCSCTRRGFCGLCQIWPERLQTHFCLCYSPASQPEIVILTQTNLIQETETYSFTFYLNLRSNKQKQGCHTPYFRHSKACTALASIGYLQQQQGQLCTGNTGNNCTYKKQVAINISHTVWSWLYLANADANYLLIWFNFFPMTP